MQFARANSRCLCSLLICSVNATLVSPSSAIHLARYSPFSFLTYLLSLYLLPLLVLRINTRFSELSHSPCQVAVFIKSLAARLVYFSPLYLFSDIVPCSALPCPALPCSALLGPALLRSARACPAPLCSALLRSALQHLHTLFTDRIIYSISTTAAAPAQNERGATQACPLTLCMYVVHWYSHFDFHH
jgi:hypothetical protein